MRNSIGAPAMTSVSTSTAAGLAGSRPSSESRPNSSYSANTLAVGPSLDATVGTEIIGRSSCSATPLARSRAFPPPIPTTTSPSRVIRSTVAAIAARVTGPDTGRIWAHNSVIASDACTRVPSISATAASITTTGAVPTSATTAPRSSSTPGPWRYCCGAANRRAERTTPSPSSTALMRTASRR